MTSQYTVELGAGADADEGRVGGKCAGLLALARAGSSVPPGFVVTVDAFEALLAGPDLRRGIGEVLERLDAFDPAGMEKRGSEIRRLVCGSPMPAPVAEAVADAYGSLCAGAGYDVPVAIRSSATAEDLPDASFAGQHDTFLWVRGTRAVLDAVQRCWSSLWTARALGYRAAQGVPEGGVGMAVILQQMVDARTAGVAMTVNPSDGDRSKIVIEACWGLGGPLMSGEVNPDHYVVDKVLLIPVRTRAAAKPRELVPCPDMRGLLRRPVDGDRRHAPCLSPDEVVEVARLAKEAERHRGLPLEIEWAFARDAGASESLQVLQSRAETVWRNRPRCSPVVPPESGAAGIANTLLGL
ncbi:PEP/pyruvate-binding domain-containing protein [Streptomyces sp. PSKA54]|uniref:Phosphoenolpyruvate synthase n=1 Tax=Streptomyces himalayensis subsp. aureolus TaxID=2758039 RepID=A0A7W2D874_9ACTN|nr:PEP/pyruvate-binding domain-containing protein [Streptomyces himalayensis]MBA4866599.1 PEP/pyruvate-binding domain-containing protein [Streptomyces himalayensis subsp. aureolus]